MEQLVMRHYAEVKKKTVTARARSFPFPGIFWKIRTDYKLVRFQFCCLFIESSG